MRSITTASVFALLTALSSAVHGAEDVKVDLQVHLVQVDAQGQEILKPAQQASPGDILHYKVVCKNTGATLARNVFATLPVPARELVFLKDQSELNNLQASVDGKQFSALPLKKFTTTKDNRIVTTEVNPADYRFLRWNVGDLPSKGSATVYARMRVIAVNDVIAGVQP
jgi:uncharacterized repeat protein (TIGR01451 family)